MFCHLYWFAAATQGKFFESAMQKTAIESESADFLAGLPSLVFNAFILGYISLSKG